MSRIAAEKVITILLYFFPPASKYLKNFQYTSFRVY